MSIKNTRYKEFHFASVGYKFYYKKKEIPKFMVFWAGFKLVDILAGNTMLNVKKHK